MVTIVRIADGVILGTHGGNPLFWGVTAVSEHRLRMAASDPTRPAPSPRARSLLYRGECVKLWPEDFMLSPFALRLMMPHGEGWGGNNLKGALAANQWQDRETLRTHPIRRPREDIFLPKQNALSP